MGVSATDLGWQRLFQELRLASKLGQNGVAYVDAEQIKRIGGREPRLMTKWDTREYRPDTLKEADCTILPVRNGHYALVRGDGYSDLSASEVPETFLTKRNSQLETFPRVCQSESESIDAAFVHGILQEFLGDPDITLTMRGRRRTPRFGFRFNGLNSPTLSVDGVQVEIDSGYEGDQVYVLEAKMGCRDNFIVRQLYYPTRMGQVRGWQKRVVPLFMTYSNQVFTLSEFRFLENDNYSSIEHVRTKSYLLETARIRPATLKEIIATTAVQPEPQDAPFPQANDIRKVIDVIDAVLLGVGGKKEITDMYEFAERQASYYGDAARYLGFLRLNRNRYELNPAGNDLTDMPARRKIERVVAAMARYPVFRSGLERAVAVGEAPAWDFYTGTLAKHRPELSGTTIARRAKATARWVNWVTKNHPVS